MPDRTLKEFSDALAAKTSVPGGGGASAAAGALGMALGRMVGAFTVGKAKYADAEPEILALMERAEGLQERLLDCIAADAEAFAPLARAYGIPKEDPERPAMLELCLRDAAKVPLGILKLCGDCLELLADFADKGSALMVSDAGTGAALCEGALRGAALNVRVNTRLMTDRAYADALDRETDVILAQYETLAERIYADVWGRLS